MHTERDRQRRRKANGKRKERCVNVDELKDKEKRNPSILSVFTDIVCLYISKEGLQNIK